jgi:hypothetical protein
MLPIRWTRSSGYDHRASETACASVWKPWGYVVGYKTVRLARVASNVVDFVRIFGEPGRNRTFNQQIKSLLLCQLSYGPIAKWVAVWDFHTATGKHLL